MYIGLTAGYGFSIGGSTNSEITVNNSNTNTYSYKSNPLNVGQGFLPNLQIGYYFNQNIGIEIGIGYLIGTKYNYNYINASTYIYEGKVITMNTINTTTYKLNSLLLNPSLIFKIPKGNWSPYLKMGLLIGVANELTRFSEFSNSGYYRETNTGGLTFGFSSAFGLEFLINKRWGLFGEFVFRYANYTPGKYSASLLIKDYSGYSFADYSISGNYTDNFSTTIPPNSNNSANLISLSNSDRHIVNYSANSLGGTIGVRYYLNVDKVSSK